MECSMTFSGINYGRRLRSANGVNHSRSIQIFQFGLLPCKTSQAHHEERDLAWGQLWTSACLTQNIHSTIRKRLGTALQSDGKKQKWVQRQKRERRERICIMISMRLRRHIKERKKGENHTSWSQHSKPIVIPTPSPTFFFLFVHSMRVFVWGYWSGKLRGSIDRRFSFNGVGVERGWPRRRGWCFRSSGGWWLVGIIPWHSNGTDSSNIRAFSEGL